jgi:hypothetical protein
MPGNLSKQAITEKFWDDDLFKKIMLMIMQEMEWRWSKEKSQFICSGSIPDDNGYYYGSSSGDVQSKWHEKILNSNTLWFLIYEGRDKSQGWSPSFWIKQVWMLHSTHCSSQKQERRIMFAGRRKESMLDMLKFEVLLVFSEKQKSRRQWFKKPAAHERNNWHHLGMKEWPRRGLSDRKRSPPMRLRKSTRRDEQWRAWWRQNQKNRAHQEKWIQWYQKIVKIQGRLGLSCIHHI